MVDKKLLKIYIIGLAIGLMGVLIPIINNYSDEHMQAALYTLPIGETGAQKATFFYLIAFFAPYLMIFVGFGIAFIVVKIYARITKVSKRIEFVGYANINRSGRYLARRYIIQVLFTSLLCMNVWISLVTNPTIMELWLTEEARGNMFSNDGSMMNFPFIPWYWVPYMVVIPIIAMCVVIQDAGLVSIKKIRGQEFVDTERIGDKLFGTVKGYAGISVIISFFILLQSPLGGELSLVLYPLQAAAYTLHFIIAIDILKNVGRKWIFKAVKPIYPPQLVEISYNKKDIADFKELLDS